MATKPGKKVGREFEKELDWYYLDKKSLGKWVLAFVLLAAGIVGAVYVWVHRDDPTPGRAGREIQRADELIAKARLRPEATRIKDEIDLVLKRLLEARTELDAGRVPQSIQIALEVQQAAQRLVRGVPEGVVGDATIIDFGGKVEVEHASRGAWEPAKVGMKLYEGDFVKTAASGQAEVMSVDGTLYKVTGGALFEVHRTASIPGATGTDPKKTSEIKLIVGIIKADTPEGGKSIVTTDAATAEIGQKSTVGVDVDQSKTTGVSAFRGTAKVSAAGHSVTLSERERAVATLGGRGISGKLRLPDTPLPQQPENNALFDVKKKEPIALRWSKVADATRYRIQIARSRLFIPDSIVVDLSDRLKPEAVVGVNEEGSFFWRVASLGRGNLSSDWSETRRFKVAAASPAASNLKDTTPPDLVLQRPQVIGNVVTVFGKTEPGATVTVNGEPADPDPTGAFKKIIPINTEGFNTIVVRAVDGAGNETVRRENVLIQTY